MAEENSKGEIEQRLAELPDDVRSAVLSAQLGEHVREIGQKHNLHIDQIGMLEDETMLVMLGFFPPETFSEQIAEQLRIPEADAALVAQEVNDQIFLPIRESMKRFTELKRVQAQTPSVQTLPSNSLQTQTVVTSAPTTVIPIQKPTSTPILPQTAVPTPAPTPSAPQINTSTTPPPPPPASPTEKMLTEPTVAKPIYKADPYREPIEP